jgi:hypothetical protein
MPSTSSLLDKLRELITHDGTSAAERSVALDRLERLVRGHDGPSSVTTRITRSSRIGRQRRAVAVDELGRLGPYTTDLSFGDCIARIARASGRFGLMPTQIDFGWHASDRPVIAVLFPTEAAPMAFDFAAAIDAEFAGARVNLANRSGVGERLFLVYPEGNAGDVGQAA